MIAKAAMVRPSHSTVSTQGLHQVRRTAPTAAPTKQQAALLTPAHLHLSTDPNADVLLVNDEGYCNAWRGDYAFDLTLAALRPYAKQELVAWYNSLLAQLVDHNGAQVTLKDLPVCSEHAREPGDTHKFKLSTLNNCALCGHWMEALGAAHSSGNHNKLAVRKPHSPLPPHTTSISSRLLMHHAPQTGIQAVPYIVARPRPWLVESSRAVHQSW